MFEMITMIFEYIVVFILYIPTRSTRSNDALHILWRNVMSGYLGIPIRQIQDKAFPAQSDPEDCQLGLSRVTDEHQKSIEHYFCYTFSACVLENLKRMDSD